MLDLHVESNGKVTKSGVPLATSAGRLLLGWAFPAPLKIPKKLGPSLVCVVAVLAPLPFGSAEPFWGAVWCALLGVALLVSGPIDARLRTPILLLLGVVAAWCAVVVLQYMPAGSLLAAYPGWDQASHLLGDHRLTPKVAAYGVIPIAAVVPPLALVLALLAGFVFGSEPSFPRRIYQWVAIAGLVYAGYGIFAELTNPSMLLWREKTAYLDALTATFVNHNTAATFFGCITIIWYLRALREIRRIVDFSRWRGLEYVANKLKGLGFYQIFYAIASFVAMATMFMTRSRAGSLLSLGVLGLVTALYFSRELKSGRRVVVGLAALAVSLVLLLEASGGRLANEIATRGVYDAGRVDTWQSSLTIVRDHPWLGTGLGTFAGVFPAYRELAGGVWGVWDRAHSTPVELLVEMGVPFSLLVFGLWSAMLVYLLRASTREVGNRLYVITGTGIGFLATLHSLVDFPLQIPGFSIVCCALLGASFAAARVPAPAHGPTRAVPERSEADSRPSGGAGSEPPGGSVPSRSAPRRSANSQSFPGKQSASPPPDIAADKPPKRGRTTEQPQGKKEKKEKTAGKRERSKTQPKERTD